MPKTFTDSPHRPQRVYSRVPLPSQFILLARPASQSFLIVREAQLDTVRVNSIPVLLVRDRLTTARDQRPSTLIPTPAHQHNPFFPTTLSLSLSTDTSTRRRPCQPQRILPLHRRRRRLPAVPALLHQYRRLMPPSHSTLHQSLQSTLAMLPDPHRVL
jgi:hypothetical protein